MYSLTPFERYVRQHSGPQTSRVQPPRPCDPVAAAVMHSDDAENDTHAETEELDIVEEAGGNATLDPTNLLEDDKDEETTESSIALPPIRRHISAMMQPLTEFDFESTRT